MCGRYSLAPGSFSEIQLQFQVDASPSDLQSRYNIAPTWAPGHEPPIVLLNSHGQRELVAARWWMIPENWRLPLAQLPTAFNARSEELANKRFWTRSFNARRCLVPATGWREFSGPSGQRQPHHFHHGHRLFAFAGIWDHWLSPEGVGVRSFAIVTIPANDVVEPIHDRMPLPVAPELYAEWLDPDMPGARALSALCNAVPGSLERYETDPAGNDVRCEGPSVVAPFRKKQLGLFD